MFGDDMSLGFRLILALVIILALIGFAVLLLKRFGMVKIGGMALGGRQPRLAVMDIAHLDSRRKLVIVRRDTVEHLVMIGGPNDVVIEQGIVRGQPAAVDKLPAEAKPIVKPVSTYAAPKPTDPVPAPLGSLEPPSR